MDNESALNNLEQLQKDVRGSLRKASNGLDQEDLDRQVILEDLLDHLASALWVSEQ